MTGAAVHLAFMRGRRSAADNSRMFRRRLTIALALLAAAAVLEGVVALWALGVADRQVQRGRVHSDIQLGFVEMSASKQRLRAWVSQRQMDAGADIAERDRLQADMRSTLQRLKDLAERAQVLDEGREGSQAEHLQRQDALKVLTVTLQDLQEAVNRAGPLMPGTDGRAAWAAVSALFEVSHGRDLRTLLRESIERESVAMARERAAADATLRWMRGLWLGAAATLALGALLLGAYFTRALRQPLDRLSRGAAALQRGELQHRIHVQGADEFAVVATSVNSMAAELQQHREREARARHDLEALVHARTAELQAALETLQQVDARRRQLFADISHELRTPTTAIRGEAEVTLRGADKPLADYKTALQRIVGTSRELALVIDDLLTMARSDIDALALHRAPTDLRQPVAEALSQARALAYERDVRIDAQLPHEPAPVLGDATRLRQLVALLLDNAVRYSRSGGVVRLSLQLQPADSDDEPAQWRLEVVDHGIGIAPAEIHRVFERHFRGEAARRHRADGTGLGLSIGAALARAHGGQITLQSPPGRGTTACLRLPVMSLPTTQPELTA